MKRILLSTGSNISAFQHELGGLIGLPAADAK
jgi:hypothetical protein